MSPRGAVGRAVALGPRVWLQLLRAVAELALARLRLSARGTEALRGGGQGNSPAELSPDQSALADRVAFAIPRAAARVPWRATCLVQALAAQRWLARMGVASELRLGARKSAGDGLDDHAWLKAGDHIVVGGDLEGYQPFRPSRRD